MWHSSVSDDNNAVELTEYFVVQYISSRATTRTPVLFDPIRIVVVLH